MRRLILRNFQSPGDIVMLTAAVRDLHLTYPHQFVTDVRTSCPALWEHNPYLTPIADDEPDVEIIDCEYPLIHKSNDAPFHFIHGFIDHLNERLGLAIHPTLFRGDIHIAPIEKTWFSRIEEILGAAVPFWVVVAGGKFDFTIKWWNHARFQQVVDHFQDRILFVQVGESGHAHQRLQNVIDLRGTTDLRQLVRLVYHAQGVLSPVTLLMHLAAAIETRPGMPRNRPCVVVAGGREPPHWEAYPHHQFIHRAGALSCCEQGGCWKSRVVPLGDGDEKDLPENCCVDVVGTLPRCMDFITPADVIRGDRDLFRWRRGVLPYVGGAVPCSVGSRALLVCIPRAPRLHHDLRSQRRQAGLNVFKNVVDDVKPLPRQDACPCGPPAIPVLVSHEWQNHNLVRRRRRVLYSAGQLTAETVDITQEFLPVRVRRDPPIRLGLIIRRIDVAGLERSGVKIDDDIREVRDAIGNGNAKPVGRELVAVDGVVS